MNDPHAGIRRPLGRWMPASSSGRAVRWAVTSRFGGVSRPPFDTLDLADHVGDEPRAVAMNRARAAQRVGAKRWATMGCVHGADVVDVVESGQVAGVDGLVTTIPGIALMALGADCAPVALVGRDGLAVGVAHCGWRGLAADVLGQAHGAVAARAGEVVAAVVGPAICGACYPVPADRVDALRGLSSAVRAAAVATSRDGQPAIDIAAGVRARLLELGVRVVVDGGGCTAEDPALFSLRRDGLTGRQGVVVVIEDPGP